MAPGYLRSILPDLRASGVHWIHGDLAHPTHLIRMAQEWGEAVMREGLLNLVDFCRVHALEYDSFAHLVDTGPTTTDMVSVGPGGWYASTAHIEAKGAQLHALLHEQST